MVGSGAERNIGINLLRDPRNFLVMGIYMYIYLYYMNLKARHLNRFFGVLSVCRLLPCRGFVDFVDLCGVKEQREDSMSGTKHSYVWSEILNPTP